jgi:hypothetical protein
LKPLASLEQFRQTEATTGHSVKNVIGTVKAYASKKSRLNTPLPASLLRDANAALLMHATTGHSISHWQSGRSSVASALRPVSLCCLKQQAAVLLLPPVF